MSEQASLPSVGVSWRWSNPPRSHNPNRSNMKVECNYPSLISDGRDATANKRLLCVSEHKRAPPSSPGREAAGESGRFVIPPFRLFQLHSCRVIQSWLIPGDRRSDPSTSLRPTHIKYGLSPCRLFKGRFFNMRPDMQPLLDVATYFHKHTHGRGFCREGSLYNKCNLHFSTPQQTGCVFPLISNTPSADAPHSF